MKTFKALIVGVLFSSAVCAHAADLKQYDSRYYTIFTDLNDADAREAVLRMTKMAEEYAARTRDLGGAVTKRLPFYLYQHDEDFLATGAPPESAGFFNGYALVARAGALDDRTWHTIQHEGFHQFAHSSIHGRLPTWLDEGLAEYFGEALFTGDSFVTGIVPQWRLERIRQSLRNSGFLPLRQVMDLSLAEWNRQFSIANYDQAWSMAHFLALGENGRLQPVFSKFLLALGAGTDQQSAWLDAFGAPSDFEPRWRAYWTKLPDDPTLATYARAQVLTLTSLLGRATAERQKFESIASLLAAARDGKIKSNADQWLPPSLGVHAVAFNEKLTTLGCTFSLLPQRAERLPQIRCDLPDGNFILGSFKLKLERVAEVSAAAGNKKS